MSAYGKILVAVDGSDAANRGLREAVRLAKEEQAQLTIVHVVNEYYAYAMPDIGAAAAVEIVPALREGGKKILAKAQAVAAKHGLKPRTVLRETPGGAAADQIISEARKQRADLIVLGTHGRRGVRRMVLGSDAEHVVRSSKVPVLLVRAED